MFHVIGEWFKLFCLLSSFMDVLEWGRESFLILPSSPLRKHNGFLVVFDLFIFNAIRYIKLFFAFNSSKTITGWRRKLAKRRIKDSRSSRYEGGRWRAHKRWTTSFSCLYIFFNIKKWMRDNIKNRWSSLKYRWCGWKDQSQSGESWKSAEKKNKRFECFEGEISFLRLFTYLTSSHIHTPTAAPTDRQ